MGKVASGSRRTSGSRDGVRVLIGGDPYISTAARLGAVAVEDPLAVHAGVPSSAIGRPGDCCSSGKLRRTQLPLDWQGECGHPLLLVRDQSRGAVEGVGLPGVRGLGVIRGQ
jgi:hypothetical protein